MKGQKHLFFQVVFPYFRMALSSMVATSTRNVASPNLRWALSIKCTDFEDLAHTNRKDTLTPYTDYIIKWFFFLMSKVSQFHCFYFFNVATRKL